LKNAATRQKSNGQPLANTDQSAMREVGKRRAQNQKGNGTKKQATLHYPPQAQRFLEANEDSNDYGHQSEEKAPE
jgi:hypothetical protein